MARYDFLTMGAKAGIGQGLKGAGENTRKTLLEIRRQDQLFQLGISNVMVSLKKLQEESRQADMRQTQFYDRLRSEDLSQIRDYKMRRALETLRSDLEMERGAKQHDFRMDEIVKQGDINRDVARIGTAAAHRRNQLISREQRYAQAEKIDSWATRFAAQKLTISEGPRAGAMMNNAELAAWSEQQGYPGGANHIKKSWYDEFSREMVDRFGKDAPVPGMKGFNALIALQQSGDVRAQQQWRQELDKKALEGLYVTPSQVAVEISDNLGSLGLTFDHTTGNLVNIDGHPEGEALRTWSMNVIKLGQSTGLTREMRINADVEYSKIAGKRLRDLTRGERATIDMYMTQMSTQLRDADGRQGERFSLNLSELPETSQDNVFARASEVMSTGTLPSGLAVSTGGFGSGELRTFGSFIGTAYQETKMLHADFQDHIIGGRPKEALETFASAHERLDYLKSKANSIAGIDDAAYDGAVNALEELISNMISDLMEYDKNTIWGTDSGEGFTGEQREEFTNLIPENR